MPVDELPNCDGRCCHNPMRVCYHKRQCGHHQVDAAIQRIRDEEAAKREIDRYDPQATRAKVIG